MTGCTEEAPGTDGDIAHATCGSSATQPGAAAGAFWQYEDQQTLETVFFNDVSDLGVAEQPEGQDCSTAPGIQSWTFEGNSGLAACWISAEEGVVNIVWTDNDALVEGLVSAPGTTQADLAALYSWWTQNSNYQL
ncbi:hypothetical protein [Geodermatophilus sp. SYSU D01105]